MGSPLIYMFIFATVLSSYLLSYLSPSSLFYKALSCYFTTMADLTMERIRPSAVVSPEVIALSPIDQIMPRLYTRFVLCFSLAPDADHKKVASDLKAGLAATLTEIPFLAGDIVAEEGGKEKVQLEIGEDAGVDFTVRDYTLPETRGLWTTGSYKELEAAHFPITSLTDSLLSPTGMIPMAPRNPVIAVQANFIDGGLLLVFSKHHSGTDGTGNMVMLKSWARNTALAAAGQKVTPTALPKEAFDRSVLMEGTPGQDIKDWPNWSKIVKTETDLHGFKTRGLKFDGDGKLEAQQKVVVPSLKSGFWYFSPSKLAALKEAASTKIPGDPWISTNDALCALIWRQVTLARDLKAREMPSSNLMVAANLRSRMSPPLYEKYLGNAATNAWQNSSVDVLCDPSRAALQRTAISIRKAVDSLNETTVRGLIGLIDSMPMVTSMTPNCKNLLGPDITITNISTSGWYTFDWGQDLGKIDRARMPTVAFDGVCVVFPKLRDGSIELLTMFEESVMEMLKADKAFTEFAEWRCS